MFHPHPHATPVDGRRHRRDPRHEHGDFTFDLRDALRHGRHGRSLVRRGEIRPLILSVLAAKPMHGYEVIQELEARSGGRWRPSAGSIYPSLQQLADEGLATAEEVDGRRVYTLTEAGRKAAAETPGPAFDTADTDADDFRRFVAAFMQVERVGSPAARSEAHRIVAEGRKELYRLLAEDASATDGA
jgi:DNA-binding PadR family transcriptional regulator